MRNKTRYFSLEIFNFFMGFSMPSKIHTHRHTHIYMALGPKFNCLQTPSIHASTPHRTSLSVYSFFLLLYLLTYLLTIHHYFNKYFYSSSYITLCILLLSPSAMLQIGVLTNMLNEISN